MADKKISELPASTALDLDDFLAVVEDGTTVQATIEDVLALSTSSGLPEGYSIPAYTQAVLTNQTATMTAAINELDTDTGGVVLVPAGTFYSQILIGEHKGLTIRGAGKLATTLVGPTTDPMVSQFGDPGGDCTFEDLTFDLTTSYGAMVVNPNDRNTTFRRCRFINIRESGKGVTVQGAINPVFEDCEFEDGGQALGQALAVNSATRGLKWIRSTARFLQSGIVFDISPHDDIDIDGGLFDGGWYLLRDRGAGYTNSGGTVTYASATNLTDSAASFADVSGANVRALVVLESGSTGTTYQYNYVSDAGATFESNNVHPGYIVRTADKWAVVESVDSETKLFVEEWFDSTTYRPTSVPTAADAYTVYKVIIGYIRTANTGTTITVDRWTDFHDGATAIPPAGTLYEVLIDHGEYSCIHASADTPYAPGGIKNIRVHGGCRLTRSWNDQLSIYGSDARLTVEASVLIDHGQDYGITSHGNRARIFCTAIHNGALNIAAFGDDCQINAYASGSPWVNDANTLYLGDIVVSGSRARLTGSVVVASGPWARHGFVVAGPTTSGGDCDANDLTGTTATGYSVAEYKLYSLDDPTVTITNTVLRDVDGVISEVGASGTIYGDASTTEAGNVELATSAETATGTDTGRAVTQAGSAAANLRPIATSGKWVRQPASSFSSAAFSDGDCRIGYIELPPCTIDRLGFVIAVVGGASCKTRPMAWADNGGVPGTVAIDGGQVATDSGTGVKNVTVSYAHPGGRLWLGLANQSSGGSPANFYYITTIAQQALWDSQPTNSAPTAPAIGATITGAPGNNPGTAWNQGGPGFVSVRIA